MQEPMLDPAYDIWRADRQPLGALFAPKTVAVVGATERLGSVGRTLLDNLLQAPFNGRVFPVNPRRQQVLGLTAYPRLQAVPDPIDLVAIATPAATVPALIEEAIAVGAKAAVVLSAGFKETGAPGVALEDQIHNHLRQSSLRLLGPNSLGIMNPHTGLNATFASTLARPGHVGFISQSGALCTAVLDWSLQENVGFSAFVSVGSMVDVDWGDLIDHLGDDPHTHSIVMYMESIGNARSFLSAAREVALTKPIIVIKAGRTPAAAQAAVCHTGSLVGHDAVLDAAFRRCGVLRVDHMAELFDLAEVLAKQGKRPQGQRLTIITNAGGPGVLATDALVATGGQLATLSETTLATLNQCLPPHWSRRNPIDILEDADPDRYAQAIQGAMADPNSDGLLVILSPQGMTNPTQTAERLTQLAKAAPTPVLASWMGGAEVTAGEALLNQAGIATYRYPDVATRLFNAMGQYSYTLQALYETPALVEEPGGDERGDRALVVDRLRLAQSQGRSLLSEPESQAILRAYGLPMVESRLALTVDQAIAEAEALGWPVVVKLVSPSLTHKQAVGGVHLNLGSGEAVERAFRAIATTITTHYGPAAFTGVTVQPMVQWPQSLELLVGTSLDPQFGPVIAFGAGGSLVHVIQDTAIALPPLNTTLARRLMERTRLYQVLTTAAGERPLEQLEHLLVRLSQLILEQPRIKALDINPLLFSTATQDLVALDARIQLHSPEVDVAQLPPPAIRPYPSQYVRPWQLRDGTPVVLRPIRPEDEPLIVQFHHSLSEESVYFRYFHLLTLNRRIAHERLTRLCFIDYDREMALVAERPPSAPDHPTILAVGRLSKSRSLNQAEFALLVSDAQQHQGLGSELLKQLIQVGYDEGLEAITADILRENRAMQRVCEKLGFSLSRSPEGVRATLQLR
jgi:acetyltransferase